MDSLGFSTYMLMAYVNRATSVFLVKFPRAAVPKYYKLGGLKPQKVSYSFISRGQNSKIKVPSVMAPHGGLRKKPSYSFLLPSGSCWQSLSFLGFWQHNSNLCLHYHMVFSLFVCFSFFSSYMDMSHTGLGSTLIL